MSYLDLPRLHFFGTFRADPSTLNNTAQNYKLQPPLAPAWNPDGSHAWQFPSCTVRSALLANGPSAGDPVVGTPVVSTDKPSTAKLVDLDTEQQMVSMIFGLQVQVGSAASGTFTGSFEPTAFNDIFLRLLGAQPDAVFSAYYQSVLTGVQWSGQLTSPLLQALRAASPDTLSIKFVVDDFQDDPTSPNFTLGRVAGTIGPVLPGEPAESLAGGRLLRPLDQQMNFAPFRIDAERSVAVFDFGNTFPTQLPPAGAAATPPLPFPDPQPADLGTLQAAILTSAEPVILGTVDYTAEAYQTTAWIQELPLTAEQLTLAQKSPLVILQDASTGILPLLQEDAAATYLAVAPRVWRLEPGAKADCELLAWSFGAPADGQSIGLALDNNILQQAPGFPVGVPVKALKIPSKVTTDKNGRASFTIKAASQGPGNPRGPIDGQVYGIAFTWALDANPDPNVAVSIHVYDLVKVPSSPTWWKDVEPILRPYDDLYPYMAQMVDLDDYAAVQAAAQEIKMRMGLPETDPRYMPVTRDMSAGKKKIVLAWIANGMPQGTKPPQ